MAAPAARTEGSGGPRLFERGPELTALEQALAGARAGDGHVVVVTGAPGAGKTALLDEAKAMARQAGMVALSGTGSVLEGEFAHGITRQLLMPALRGLDPAARAAVLDGAAAARRVLGYAGPEPVPPRPDFAVLDALYWVAVALAERAPAVLVADDLQWADLASLRWLDYLSRRLEGLPVLLVAAFRADGHAPSPLLDGIAGAARVELRPGPLPAAACGALAGLLRGEPADDEFAAAVHEATGGNPLLVHELVRATDVRPVAASVDALRAAGATAVARTVRRRLADCGEHVTALLRAVAVLGDGTPLPRLVRFADLSADDGQRALGVLVERHVLQADPAIGFIHPVVREAVLESVPAPESAALHRRAVDLLRSEGAPARELARHLLRSPPAGNETIVDLLREAAAAAADDGDPGAACRLLQRALVEPPPPALEAIVAWEATVLALLSDFGTARTFLGRLRSLARDDLARAQVGFRAAELDLWLDPAAAEREAALAIDVLAGVDDLLDHRLRTVAALASLLRGPPRPVHEPSPHLAGRIAGTGSRRVPDGPGAAIAAAADLYRRALAGDGAAAALAAEAVAVLGAAGPDELDAYIGYLSFAHYVLVAADGAEAPAVAEGWVAASRRSGAVGTFGAALSARATVDLAHGDLESAIAAGEAAAEALERFGIGGLSLGHVHGTLVEALVERGDVARARALVSRSPAAGSGVVYGTRRLAEVRFLAATGDQVGALEGALALGRDADAAGIVNPALFPWRSEAALLLGGGATAPGTPTAVELAEAEVDLARHWGAPRALGRALRVLGRVSGSLSHLEEACAVTGSTPFTLEHARCTVALGAHLRRAGRPAAARVHLRRAAALAEACGADPLHRLAVDELVAAGAKPRRSAHTGPAALTRREDKVARLAAGGRSNREIAQELYVTLRTVELHLTNAYRKLGVASRAQLADALATDP